MAALGEVLRKLATDIYGDLLAVIRDMKSQDSELRTSIMKLFISRTKRKLSECFAIARWLSFSGIMRCTQSVNELKFNLSAIENKMGQKLDELYFSHASIYSLRSRPLEIAAANGVLTSGQYISLPSSIFACGLSCIPEVREGREVVDDLSLFIHAKLVTMDRVPAGSQCVVSVEGGVVTIVRPCHFELVATLKQLSANSAWNILGFRILAADCAAALCQPPLSFAQLEASTVQLLRTIANSDVAVLCRVLRACQHSATAASLRLLHRQAVESSSAVWRGAVQAAVTEATSATQLNVQLWQSVFSRCVPPDWF